MLVEKSGSATLSSDGKEMLSVSATLRVIENEDGVRVGNGIFKFVETAKILALLGHKVNLRFDDNVAATVIVVKVDGKTGTFITSGPIAGLSV